MMNLARPLRIFLWSYVFIYAVVCSLTITQVDTWWQLAEGWHILQTGSLPAQPVAAFGLPATPYFDEYAGYEVVIALIYHITGFIGLWMFFAAVFLAILFLPGATTSQKYPAFDFPSTLAMLGAILLLHARLAQRPETVGILLQVVLMILLRGSSLLTLTPKTLLWLFFVFVAWSNTHDTFVFGLFTLGLWFFSEWWTHAGALTAVAALRRGALLAATALAASVLTPYGPRRLLFPFDQAADPGSMALSPEMWPTVFTTPVACVFVIWVTILAWGILTTPRLAPWLIAFAVFSVVITLRNSRFVEYAAIPLLFVFAEYREQSEGRGSKLPWLITCGRSALTGVLCLFFLYFDAFSLLIIYDEMRAERSFATFGLRYASDMAAYPVEAANHRIPVLCGHGMGSYLSFEGHGNFGPLLDSGMSHFSSDTKRYFFFAWNEPEALELILKQLHVNYVLLDKDTFPWIPTLVRLPDWELVTCSSHGMMWKRSSGGARPLRETERRLMAESIQQLLQKGDDASAFDFSTLMDAPEESLTFLAGEPLHRWKEVLFNSFSSWAAALPKDEVESLLATDSCRQCPLIGAVLAARLGPERYHRFIATNPQDPGVWYGKAIAVKMLLAEGKTEEARKMFASISPVPPASTFYYRLWQEVYSGQNDVPALTGYGRWQTWDDDARCFIGAMSQRLNDRLAVPAPLP